MWTTATSDQCRTASFAAAQAMSRPCGRLPASCAALPVPSTACARTATHAGSRNSKRQDFPATEGRQPLHTPPLSPQASRHTKPRRHLPAPTPHSQHSHRTHLPSLSLAVMASASARSRCPSGLFWPSLRLLITPKSQPTPRHSKRPITRPNSSKTRRSPKTEAPDPHLPTYTQHAPTAITPCLPSLPSCSPGSGRRQCW